MLPYSIGTVTDSDCVIPIINASSKLLQLFPGTRLFSVAAMEFSDNLSVSTEPSLSSKASSSIRYDSLIDPSLSHSESHSLQLLPEEFSTLFDSPGRTLDQASNTTDRIFLLNETPICQRLRR